MPDPIDSTTSTAENDDGFPLPSVSYHDAAHHLDYRLSEFVFGSLVVAYVLGFVAFLATKIGRAQHPESGDNSESDDVSPAVNPDDFTLAIRWDDIEPLIPQFIVFISISLSFAFMTAGIYRAYHFTILPRPTVPFKRMHYDFLIALLHAVAYGIAMCVPPYFFPSIAFIFAALVLRQYIEYFSLRKFLHEKTHLEKYKCTKIEARESDPTRQQIRREFSKELREYLKQSKKPLQLWGPISLLFLVAAIALAVFSYVVIISPNTMLYAYPAFLALVFLGYRHTLSYGALDAKYGPVALDKQVIEMCKHFKVPVKTNVNANDDHDYDA